MKNRLSQLKKTLTAAISISRKMWEASSINTELNQHYKELGKLTHRALKSGELNWPDPMVRILSQEISEMREMLDQFEEKVQKIKKESAQNN